MKLVVKWFNPYSNGTLSDFKYTEDGAVIISLNPYSNGTLSDFSK